MMKLHLGCGRRNIPGFIHIDLESLPHIDYVHDIGSLPMIENESVDLIYCSHSFEYFDRGEAPTVLRDWYRVLSPGGILRLAVPDFAALVQIYKKYHDLNLILGPLYGRWEVGTDESYIVFHKTVYDFSSLKSVLESCGFITVHRYDWKKTIHKDYDDYSQSYIPHMRKDTGILISLNIEAKKPYARKS